MLTTNIPQSLFKHHHFSSFFFFIHCCIYLCTAAPFRVSSKCTGWKRLANGEHRKFATKKRKSCTNERQLINETNKWTAPTNSTTESNRVRGLFRFDTVLSWLAAVVCFLAAKKLKLYMGKWWAWRGTEKIYFDFWNFRTTAVIT